MKPRRWIDDARERLLCLRGRLPGWSYQGGGDACVEPTVLACLSLLATAVDDQESLPVVRSAADWLVSLQQSNGSLGVSASIVQPQWPTPYAVLLWATQQGYSISQERAATWILGCRGHTVARDPHGPASHDTTIAGWPWVANTHSWLEPTALAVLALRRHGLAAHTRTQDGVHLIRDRALPTGGWNYGNSLVFGTGLRPQPAPTGLALLALAQLDTGGDMVERACGYLQAALLNVCSATSLGWGLLGLSAWGRRPADADRWLEEAYAHTLERSITATALSYLLLAAAAVPSLYLMGIDPPQ